MVAGGVGQEGLAARSHRSGVAHVDAAVAQLGHRGVEVLDLQGEVLAHPRRRGALDQVDLLATGVEPGPSEREVGPVAAGHEAEHARVEPEGRLDVVDVDGHVMDGERSHHPSLSPTAVRRGRNGRRRPPPARGPAAPGTPRSDASVVRPLPSRGRSHGLRRVGVGESEMLVVPHGRGPYGRQVGHPIRTHRRHVAEALFADHTLHVFIEARAKLRPRWPAPHDRRDRCRGVQPGVAAEPPSSGRCLVRCDVHVIAGPDHAAGGDPAPHTTLVS